MFAKPPKMKSLKKKNIDGDVKPHIATMVSLYFIFINQ